MAAMRIAGILTVAGVILLTACSTRNAHQTGSSDDLTGSWQCVSAVVDGKPLSEQTVNRLRLTLTETRYITHKGNEKLFDSTYTTDTSRTPKQINMVGTEGELAGKVAQGIYAVDGAILRLCYTMPGRPRPISFDSPTGSGAYFLRATKTKELGSR
jgi:uncharacterized protein (TIGR03067 family)